MVTKVRYRQEVNSRGVLVLESTPQMRSVLRYRKAMLLPFPYIIHIICYRKEHDKYKYGGLSDQGLCVYFSNEPLNSMNSMLCFSPTDESGVVCTNHMYDLTTYDSLPKLVNTVLGLWYGALHTFYDINLATWRKLALEKITNVNWRNAYPLRVALESNLVGYCLIKTILPKNAVLVSEDHI